jgi:hypothetical protein
VLLALAVALLAAPRAQAESVTWTHGATGAKVTLDPGSVVPGGQVQISGTGFFRATGSGLPWIAIKPDDQDLFWGYGGPDRITGEAGEAPIWFQAREDGTFSGYIDVPEGTSTTGPAGGANAGKHWFRILGGVFSSDGASPTPVTTFEAFFTVVQKIETGSLGPTGLYRTGTHVTQGGLVTLRGATLPAATPVAIRLDDGPLSSNVTTDADGKLTPGPSTGVTIPAETPIGAHELTFTVGTETITVPITVHAPPSATVRNPAVRPGGLVDVSVKNFVGVAGTGQKVGVLIGQGQAAPTVACIQTDASGAGRATVRVPAGQTGTQPIRFPAGSKCQTPADAGFAADDLPARPATGSLSQTLTIDEAAPAATVVGRAIRGENARITGVGFPAGTSLTAEIDGVPVEGPIAVGADGSFTANLPISSGLALGEHVVVVVGAGSGAGTTFVVEDPAPQQPQPGPGPDTTTTTTTTTPTPVVTVPTPPATPKPTPPKVLAPTLKAFKVRGTALRLTLGGTKGRKVAVTVKSRGKIRVSSRSKAKIVTFAKATTTRTGVVSFRLTSDGRKALKRLRKVAVTVTLRPSGAKAVTKTITLRA